MSAFNAGMIPPGITTIEQLHAWTGMILNDLYPTLTAIEDTNISSRVAVSSPFFVDATTPVTWRMITRTSLPINVNWRRSKSGLWLSIQEIGTITVPTDYTT